MKFYGYRYYQGTYTRRVSGIIAACRFSESIHTTKEHKPFPKSPAGMGPRIVLPVLFEEHTKRVVQQLLHAHTLKP